MDFSSWRPADVLSGLTLAGQLVFGIVLAIGIFTTKKYVDGRMSQLIDLVGRLSGVPDLREGLERRWVRDRRSVKLTSLPGASVGRRLRQKAARRRRKAKPS